MTEMARSPGGVPQWSMADRLRKSRGRSCCGDAPGRRAAGTPHSLRHWYGTTLLRSTGNLRVVQQCLRHASLATTAVYTLVVDDETRAAAESLPHRPRLHVA